MPRRIATWSVEEPGARLAVTLDTNIHADHITAASRLKQETGSAIAHPAIDVVSCVDRPVREGEPLVLGSVRLDPYPLYTPGHTDGHNAYLLEDRVLTGDGLLIDGCGRTDFQGGDAATLYRSIHDKLFSLPGETLVYAEYAPTTFRITCRNATIGSRTAARVNGRARNNAAAGCW